MKGGKWVVVQGVREAARSVTGSLTSFWCRVGSTFPATMRTLHAAATPLWKVVSASTARCRCFSEARRSFAPALAVETCTHGFSRTPAIDNQLIFDDEYHHKKTSDHPHCTTRNKIFLIWYMRNILQNIATIIDQRLFTCRDVTDSNFGRYQQGLLINPCYIRVC